MVPFLKDNYEDILSFYNHPSLQKLPLSFGNETIHLAQHVEIDNTIKQLSIEHFTFHIDDEIFTLTDKLHRLTEATLKEKRRIFSFTNEKNVRLKKVKQVGKRYFLHVQPVFYESHLRTNMAMDFPVKDGKSLRDIVHTNGGIEPLETSVLANQLGINILIFTKEGDLILTKRSNKVNYAAGKIAPSVSGSVSIDDITNGHPFTPEMVFREGTEELGLTLADIEPGSLIFLGLIRELLRGGKPDFYFVLQIRKTFHEVIKTWKNAKDYFENDLLIRVPFERLAFEPLVTKLDEQEFNQKIYKLLQRYYGNMSLSLLSNLSLWVKYKQVKRDKEKLLA